MNPFESLRPAAHFLKALQALPSGKSMKLHKNELLDFELPLDPMRGRMDDADRARWFADRCEFYCQTWPSGDGRTWHFRHHPKIKMSD